MESRSRPVGDMPNNWAMDETVFAAVSQIGTIGLRLTWPVEVVNVNPSLFKLATAFRHVA